MWVERTKSGFLIKGDWTLKVSKLTYLGRERLSLVGVVGMSPGAVVFPAHSGLHVSVTDMPNVLLPTRSWHPSATTSSTVGSTSPAPQSVT